MTAFQISKKWLTKRGASELDATMAELRLVVDGRNVSEFTEDDSQRFDHLEIPAYYLAEWIAENWWPLLWEPRKSEEGTDDPEFLSRHSMLAAQHGFALPRIMFVPTGRTIHITARARDASPFVDVRFRNSAEASPSREDVEKELRAFVDAVCSQLNDSHVHGTGLQEAWQSVLDIAPEEQQFCRFAGALGLDPHEVNDAIASLLDRLLERLGERLLMDLCLVAPASNFEAIAATAESAFVGLEAVAAADIRPLLNLPTPADNFAVPAWRRGVQAAKQLRKRLEIKETDPHGATRVFERLGLHTERYGRNVENEASLTGAVARNKGEARVALLQPALPQRRFAAARAVFTAWTSEQHELRFLTSAVTRDQQANRAFAAELTAPYALLRARSKQSKLSQNQVFDLAAELQIGADVVSKQALNNGLQVNAF
jgi:hypothetical protein